MTWCLASHYLNQSWNIVNCTYIDTCMQEGCNPRFTDFGIFAYYFCLVSILQLCEILMTLDNDNTEQRQGECAKKLHLSMQERRKSHFGPSLGHLVLVRPWQSGHRHTILLVCFPPKTTILNQAKVALICTYALIVHRTTYNFQHAIRAYVQNTKMPPVKKLLVIAWQNGYWHAYNIILSHRL